MKIKVWLGVGIVGASREEVIDVPDEYLEGLDGNDREDVLNEIADDWASNYLDIGYMEV